MNMAKFTTKIFYGHGTFLDASLQFYEHGKILGCFTKLLCSTVRVECLPKAGNFTCDCENITVAGKFASVLHQIVLETASIGVTLS